MDPGRTSRCDAGPGGGLGARGRAKLAAHTGGGGGNSNASAKPKGGGEGGSVPAKKCLTMPEGCPYGSCWDYYSYGSCARSAVGKCSFTHTSKRQALAAAKATAKSKAKPKAKTKAKPKTKDMLPGSINEPCRFFQAGKCNAGAKCAFRHGDGDRRLSLLWLSHLSRRLPTPRLLPRPSAEEARTRSLLL